MRRYQSSDRDLVDSIREVLGLSPIYQQQINKPSPMWDTFYFYDGCSRTAVTNSDRSKIKHINFTASDVYRRELSRLETWQFAREKSS
jgi:hypothetical protein